MVVQRAFGGNSDRAEQAKPHRRGGFGMVTGRAGDDEGVRSLTGQHRVDGSAGSTDRPQGRLPGCRRHPGFGVQFNRAGFRRGAAYGINVRLRMAAEQVMLLRKRRGATGQRHSGKATFDRSDPLHPFRMAGRRHVSAGNLVSINYRHGDPLFGQSNWITRRCTRRISVRRHNRARPRPQSGSLHPRDGRPPDPPDC